MLDRPALGEVVRPELLDEWAGGRERVQRCAALLGAALTHELLRQRLSEAEAARLKRHASIEILHRRVLRRRGIELCERLENDGIPCVAIKGLANGTAFWSYPELRAFADIDVLFTPADLPRAVAWFRDRGFRAVLSGAAARLHSHTFLRRLSRKMLVSEGGCPLVPPERDVVVDIHEHVERNPVPRTMRTEDILAASARLSTPWGGLRVPSPGHAFIIAALHAHRSHYDGNQTKTVLDGIVLAQAYPEVIAEQVPALARAGGFWRRILFFAELMRVLCREDPLPALPAWPPSLPGVLDGVVARITLREDRPPAAVTKLRQHYALADTLGEYTYRHLARLKGLAAPWTRVPPGLDTITLR